MTKDVSTAVAPLPTRRRPGAPLDVAADWEAFARSLPPLLAAAPPEGRDAAVVLAGMLAASRPIVIDAAGAREWLDLLPVACPGMDQREYGRDTNIERAACRRCFAHFAAGSSV